MSYRQSRPAEVSAGRSSLSRIGIAQRWIGVTATALVISACGGSRRSTPLPPEDSGSPPEDAGSRIDGAAPDDSEFVALRQQYGTLSTVAGKGAIRDKGVNGWTSAYEGGDPLAAELSRPHIALGDSLGRIYVADKDAHAIRRIDGGLIHTLCGTGTPGDDGDGPTPAATARLSSPNGLWLENEVLYILDLGNDKVRRLDLSTRSLRTLFVIGGAGTGRGLWVSPEESLAYVAAGTALKRWTPAQGVAIVASGFISLGNLIVDPDGAIVVTDRGAHRVYRIDPQTGARTALAGNGTADGGASGDPALAVGLDEVRGVWRVPDLGLLLATHNGGQIWYVDTHSQAHLFVDGDNDHSHSGDGQRFDSPGKKISEPRAVTLDALGHILITESDYGYIRRIERSDL